MAVAESTQRLFRSGELIAKARDDAGMTQQQLADALGVHRNTIGRWEADNDYEPSWANLRRIAAVTNAQWLLSKASELLTLESGWGYDYADSDRHHDELLISDTLFQAA